MPQTLPPIDDTIMILRQCLASDDSVNESSSSAIGSASSPNLDDASELPVIHLAPRISYHGDETLYGLGGCRSARDCAVAVIGKDGWRVERSSGPMYFPTSNYRDHEFEDYHHYVPTVYADLSEQVLSEANDRGLRPVIMNLLTAPFSRFCSGSGRSRITLIRQENDEGEQPLVTVAQRVKAMLDPWNRSRAALSLESLFQRPCVDEIADQVILYVSARHPSDVEVVLSGWGKFVAAIACLGETVATRVYIDWDNETEPSEEMMRDADLVEIRSPSSTDDDKVDLRSWSSELGGTLLTHLFHAVVADYSRANSGQVGGLASRQEILK